MGDAFYSEDSAYAYYRAVREQSSPDAVPTFTINPTGTYLVALDKAFRQE